MVQTQSSTKLIAPEEGRLFMENKTDGQILYDLLDRLAHSIVDKEGQPAHRYSPVGAALHGLHRLRHLATERCICADTFDDPPA